MGLVFIPRSEKNFHISLKDYRPITLSLSLLTEDYGETKRSALLQTLGGNLLSRVQNAYIRGRYMEDELKLVKAFGGFFFRRRTILIEH